MAGISGAKLEAVIDFKSPQQITNISSTYLQDSKAWILMPKKVEYYASMNGKDFILLKTIDNTIDPKDEKVQIKDLSGDILPTEARYIKVKLTIPVNFRNGIREPEVRPIFLLMKFLPIKENRTVKPEVIT